MNRSRIVFSILALSGAAAPVSANGYAIESESGLLRIEPYPLGDGFSVIHVRTGEVLATIRERGFGVGYVIVDPKTGEELGRVKVKPSETGERPRRDWREGPAKRWGSHSERWGGE